ncbi:MAG: hypothetical protein AAGJ73_07235 [Pseudomonadota bacterium]
MTRETVSAQTVHASIRSRIAFEKLVLSVLYGALISATLFLAWQVLAMIFAASVNLAAFARLAFATIYYAFLVFLGGFLAAVGIGMPLFELLERRKFRKAWPYFIAAIIVSLALLALLRNGAIFTEEPIAETVFVVAPGMLIATIFTNLIRPVWWDAELAEAETPSANIVRIH